MEDDRQDGGKVEGRMILVVDDIPESIEIVKRNLEPRGYMVLTAGGAAEAARILVQSQVDLVITDYKMPRTDGLDLIRHVRENHPGTAVIMVTGYASVEGAVEAMKVGAEEYLAKPFTSEELLAAVARVIEKVELRRSVRSLSLNAPLGFIGESEAMKRVYADIEKAARTSANVLVCGESGTGKELVARAIHYRSDRGAAPFLAVNCGGIPEGLLESELFGHLRGAFTGATETRAGFFQTADGGTIFLDEVSETTAAMQVKLLRVLQEREIVMVGSSKPVKVDVRVIAATNKDLSMLVHKGQFREDLFYRLDVICIEVPPLRTRGDDVLTLIGRFADKYARESGLPEKRFTDRALSVLRSYGWPGNVRELDNTIQRLVVMTDGDLVDVADLPPMMRACHIRESDGSRTLAQVEAEHILGVLASVGGNKSRAAEILGIDRKTLRLKLARASNGLPGR